MNVTEILTLSTKGRAVFAATCLNWARVELDAKHNPYLDKLDYALNAYFNNSMNLEEIRRLFIALDPDRLLIEEERNSIDWIGDIAELAFFCSENMENTNYIISEMISIIDIEILESVNLTEYSEYTYASCVNIIDVLTFNKINVPNILFFLKFNKKSDNSNFDELYIS